MEHEEEQQIKDIRQSSSFVLDDVFQSKEEMKEKLQKFQNDFDEEFDDIEERIFVQNIISYFQWRLNQRENAFKSVNIIENLQKKPHLITHCNKILFYRESGDHYLSKKLLKDFKNSDYFKQNKTKLEATAEIGYCYSRLGPKYHDRAVQLLKEAIANITPERNILWEYRLAVTLRRQTHIFQMTTPEIFKPDETKEEAAKLLNEILKFKSYDKSSLRIKAKACCDLGTLLFRREHLFKIIHIDKEETEKITECWCFEEAMRLCPNQYYVLQHYGRHLRYTQNLKESKNMLERAMQLKETVFSRHHLALTLKKIVEKATPKPRFRDICQFPYSIVDRDKPKHDSRGFDGPEFDSFSVNAGKNADNPIQDESDPCKSSLASTFEISLFHKKREHKNPYHSKAGVTTQRGTFISTKKSPRYVCVSPKNPMLLEAVEHLRRAIEMSKEFEGTRYDLGLIYRMLDRLDDALKCFSFITSSNCGNPSDYPMYVINAYEQQAFCKLDLLARETDPEKKNELRYDAEECAWRALTIVSGVIAAIPMLKRTNQCYPTLKELLQNEDNSLKTLNKLAKMNKLMHHYEESIELYKKIIKKEKHETFVRELAKAYIEMKDFKNAIYTLSLLLRTPEASISDKSLFVTTCIEEAQRLLIENNDLEMAKIRFRDAYRAICSHQHVSTPSNKEDESSLDILVLHSCGEDDCWYQNFVTSTLKTFVQLRFAENDDDCLGSHRRPEYLEDVIARSRCVLIIQHERINCAGNIDKLIDQTVDDTCVYHKAKILKIRKQEVKQHAPRCKEIVLTCGPSDMVKNDRSEILFKGKLFSNILGNLSEMFLRKSVDL